MKRRILCLAAVLCLLLTGCNWMDGSYVSVTPRQAHSQTDQRAEFSASDLTQLRQALSQMVSAGREKGVIFVGGYDQTRVDIGMSSAVEYTCTMTPLGAYAVETIDYELGNSGGKPAIAVDITYRRSLTELRSIRKVPDLASAGDAVLNALKNFDTVLALEVADYDQTDITQMVEDFAQLYPQHIMETPQVAVGVYPESGQTRIVELKFTYQNSRDTLRQMREQVSSMFGAAARYVGSDSDDNTKLSRLYVFLMGLYREQETSLTPAYSLLQHGVGDAKALTTVYAAMCRQAGLECLLVTGTRNGEPRSWLIVGLGENYYHVDILRSMEQGGLRTYTDAGMNGYVWDYSAYPACPGAQTAAPEEPGEDTGETTPEAPTEDPTEEPGGEPSEPSEENLE